jgi:hypothetical protein
MPTLVEPINIPLGTMNLQGAAGSTANRSHWQMPCSTSPLVAPPIGA